MFPAAEYLIGPLSDGIAARKRGKRRGNDASHVRHEHTRSRCSTQRFPKDPRQTEYVKVHDALARGAIKGFFCDTLVIIEGLQRNDRAAVLASTSLRTEILPQTVDPDGIPAIPINLKVEQRRPSLHPEMAARVSAALGLGLRVLEFPRVGRLRIEDRDGTIYVSEPDTAALSAKLRLDILMLRRQSKAVD